MSDNVTSALRFLHSDNFVVYFKSHAFHFNVIGPTFSQDHALFKEVYDYLYEWHDTLGELLRQMDKPVVSNIKSLLDLSEIGETKTGLATGKAMIPELSDDLEALMKNAQWIFDNTNKGEGGLNTMIGDYIAGLSKLNWKLKASV